MYESPGGLVHVQIQFQKAGLRPGTLNLYGDANATEH